MHAYPNSDHWNTPGRLPVHFSVVIDVADFSQLELHELTRI